MAAMSRHQKSFSGRVSEVGKYTIRLDLVEDDIVVTCMRGDSITIYRRVFSKKDIDQANECFNNVRLLTEIKITLDEKRGNKETPPSDA